MGEGSPKAPAAEINPLPISARRANTYLDSSIVDQVAPKNCILHCPIKNLYEIESIGFLWIPSNAVITKAVSIIQLCLLAKGFQLQSTRTDI